MESNQKQGGIDQYAQNKMTDEQQPSKKRNLKLLETPEKITWTEEDDRKLFTLFKKYGSKWSIIAKEYKNRTENQVKNRFYSTLRRIATKKKRENPGAHIPDPKCKNDLLQYVDDALEYGHSCCSKRGRMKKRPEPMPPMGEGVEFMPFSFPPTKMAAISPPQMFLPYMPYKVQPNMMPFMPMPVPMADYPGALSNAMLFSRSMVSPMQDHTGTAASLLESPNLLAQMQNKLREVTLLQQNIIEAIMEGRQPCTPPGFGKNKGEANSG